jgi:hypothetical protein
MSGFEKALKKSRSEETLDAYNRAVARYGNPIEALADIAYDQGNPIDLRLRALQDFTKYGNAQLKAIEISGPDGGDIPVKIDLRDKVLAALARLEEAKKAQG